MALAILRHLDQTLIKSNNRILKHGEWQTLSHLNDVTQSLCVELQKVYDEALVAAKFQLNLDNQEIERKVQFALLLKAIEMEKKFNLEIEKWNKTFVETLLSSLKSILGKSLPAEYFVQVEKSAKEFVGDRSLAILNVSPFDEESALKALGPDPVEFRWQVDPVLEAGECYMQSRFGRIDASLGTQLNSVETNLREWWSEQSASFSVR
jgi:flagellar biosynthesis/type III secretory pathway protein FliH